MQIRINQSYGLNIIAIIGPGIVFGKSYSHVLLSEIGIGKSRPYHAARDPRTGALIAKRRRWATLSKEQYAIVAPSIWNFLTRTTHLRTSKWKSRETDTGFRIRHPKKWYSRSKAKGITTYSESSYVPPRGCRFSVHGDDVLFLSDLHWAELHSLHTQRYLGGLARFIDLVWRRYRVNGFRIPFERLRYVREIREELATRLQTRKITPDLLVETLSHFPRGKQNPLWQYFTQMLFDLTGIATLEETSHRKAIRKGLPHHKERVNGLQVRTLNDRGRVRKESDSVVFEIFAPEPLAP